MGPAKMEIESFLDPVKWHRADRRVPFRAEKNCSETFITKLALIYIHERKLKVVRLSNITALLPPITKLIRNQEETVRYVKERSGT